MACFFPTCKKVCIDGFPETEEVRGVSRGKKGVSREEGGGGIERDLKCDWLATLDSVVEDCAVAEVGNVVYNHE